MTKQALLTVALIIAALPAYGRDGVVEINQARALAGGVTGGDFPDFPVTISQPGSYRLTSNLDVSGVTDPANRVGIYVVASNVTLDLNGFAILGPTECGDPGQPVVCTPTGGGHGIWAHTSAPFIIVRDGSVKGMGGNGIKCGGTCIVENVTAAHNGGIGIHLSNRPGVLRGSVARRNGGDGIWWAGVIQGNASRQNGGVGIFGNSGSAISGNASDGNEGNGIDCLGGLLIDNVMISNGGYGADLFRAGWGGNHLSLNLAPTTGSGLQVSPNACTTGACP